VAEKIRSFELSGEKTIFNYNQTNSKEVKKKCKLLCNRSKKSAHRGHSARQRYRSWWKQGNIKMAVSEGHASRWDHKDIIVTTKQIWGRCLQQRGRQVEKTNVKYDLQASSGNTR